MLCDCIAKAYCSGGGGANSIWLVVVRIRLVQDLFQNCTNGKIVDGNSRFRLVRVSSGRETRGPVTRGNLTLGESNCKSWKPPKLHQKGEFVLEYGIAKFTVDR